MLPLSLITMRAGLSVRRPVDARSRVLPRWHSPTCSSRGDWGGYNFDYALHFTRAHYLAVLAVCCFAAAAALALRDLRALRASKPE